MTAPDTAEEAGFGLYVHWPFCLSKCPYCDFNSHVRDHVDGLAWQRALIAELDHFAAETKGRRLTSIFFGGGTPSLMPPEIVGRLIERAHGYWPVGDDLEVTLEANPTSVEAGRFAALRAAGVNRVSLGVQALDNEALRFLGRGHDAQGARSAVAAARRIFDRVSFDLIYARPGQTVAGWQAELDEALALADGHLSVYQLTIEPGTAFAARHARGKLDMPDEEVQIALYETTQDQLNDAGLPAYEVSNHARPGQASRHNLTYWRYGDYVGIGPGAHGRLTLGGERLATRTHRAPEVWLSRVQARGHGEHAREAIDPPTRVREAMLMGLRLAEGVPRHRLLALAGGEDRLASALPSERVAELVAAGYLVDAGQRIAATAAGRQRLNAVLSYLLP